MQEPKGYCKFYLFKDKISSRYDRSDPNWSSTIESSISPEK